MRLPDAVHGKEPNPQESVRQVLGNNRLSERRDWRSLFPTPARSPGPDGGRAHGFIGRDIESRCHRGRGAAYPYALLQWPPTPGHIADDALLSGRTIIQ